MIVLGIESTCDETAAALVEDGRHLLSNVISTSVKEQALYGGVVPEIASRRHAEAISGVARQALEDAGTSLGEIGAVAVTCAPGLIGALLVVTVEAILPYALAFAAGAMILVAVHELIPECQQNQKEQPYCATMGIILGFAVMMLLDVMLG